MTTLFCFISNYKQLNDCILIHTMKNNSHMKLSRHWLAPLLFSLIPAILLPEMKAAEEILLPTQDAFIRPGSSADDNFNKAQIEVAGRTRDVNRKIYLQYELPRNASGTTGAKLRLTVKGVIANDGDPSEASVPIRVFAALHDDPGLWNEASITWNNAPGNSSGPMVADEPWVEVGNIDVTLPLTSPNQELEINLPDLPPLLNKGKDVYLTLILTPATQKVDAPGLYFHSTQVAGKQDLWPTLILTR